MAGYVKVWTTISDNDKFLSLSLIQRGAYLQLLISAKKGRDDGTIYYRDWTALGSDWGCDRKTSGKILGILREKSLCTYTQNSDSVIQIEIANYKHWQEIDVKGVREKPRNSPGKIPPLKANQSKPKHTKPEHTSADNPPEPVDEFVEKYREICQSKGLKKVLVVNNSRRGKIRQRLKELSEAGVTIEEYMHKIANSPFLRGDRGNWTGADFDFIIGAQNIGKILDGKYDRRDSDMDWSNIGVDNEEE